MIRNLVHGWANLLISYFNEEGEQVSKKVEDKLKICENCKSREGSKCKICGCYLPAKVRSDSNCPKKLF